MKKIIAALLLVVAIVSAAWRVGEKEIFVSKYYSKLSQIVKDNNLKCDFYPNGKARLYVIDQEISLLERSGIEYKIIKEDLKAFAENFWTSEVPSGYYTTAEITDLADSLSNAFPDLCQKYVFGATALGTELAALKITDNPDIDENEAEVMFDGGIHGD
ncbi:MAG: hypothetical protein JXR48_02735, partial [Candidatus Delongbacteria bacterium]|nr:hypothetical protein [Candidatus Delongbacteria bacterium]